VDAVSATVVDLAAERKRLAAERKRSTALDQRVPDLIPPPGRRVGDRVRHVVTGEHGTVFSYHAEHFWCLDGPRSPFFMLGVDFPASGRTIVLAEDVVPADAPEIAPPVDVELP
jgi:hypothetical protein